MFNVKKTIAACGVVALVYATGAAGASAFGLLARKTTYLSFNVPVALPGVTLGTGNYIFELMEPHQASGVVRVLSRDRSRIYYTGLTLPVTRVQPNADGSLVSLGEAPASMPQPITAWWPYGGADGRQFYYGR
jgi:hypothetical protein